MEVQKKMHGLFCLKKKITYAKKFLFSFSFAFFQRKKGFTSVSYFGVKMPF